MSRLKYLVIFVLICASIGTYVYVHLPTPTSQQIPNLPLEGTEWSWVKTTYPFAFDKVPARAVFELFLVAGGQFGVGTDCNSGGGKYSTNGRLLSFEENNFIMTKIGCGASQQNEYISMLSSTVSYTYVDKDQLILHLKSPGSSMIFRRVIKP